MATPTGVSTSSNPGDLVSHPRAPVVSAAAAARRAKKREQDRRSQRMARERTKARLAYLEELVTKLKEQDSTKQLQAFWKERDEIAAERDAMAQTLRTIQRIIQDNKKVAPTTDDADHNTAEVQLASPLSPFHSNSSQQSLKFPAEILPSMIQDACLSTHHPDLIYANQSNSFIPNSTGPSQLDFDWPEPEPSFHNGSSDVIVPLPVGSCDCTPVPNTYIPKRPQPNLWRLVNEILAEKSDWSALISAREDALKDDIPVRALIEGWDAAERHAGGDLPPLWQKLRRIDEAIFRTCARRERLAILRIMHSLLLYHQEPSSARQAAVPQWYLARPSQVIAHSYAIDFVGWPGLRERFVFHQHRYCSNKFWKLLCTHLRILWPFEFRDCYTHNTYTGGYKLSSSFQERVKDIRSWTMSSGIFETWPEFLSDIPVYDSVPASLSLQAPPGQSLLARDDWSSAMLGVANSSRTYPDAEAAGQNVCEFSNQDAISGVTLGPSPTLGGGDCVQSCN